MWSTHRCDPSPSVGGSADDVVRGELRLLEAVEEVQPVAELQDEAEVLVVFEVPGHDGGRPMPASIFLCGELSVCVFE